jgi:hypothetical protein
MLTIVFEACMRSQKCGRAAVQVLTVSRHTFILHLVYLQTKANQSHAPWTDMLTIVFEAFMQSHKCGRAAMQDLTVSRHTFILHLVYLQTKANQSQPKSCPVNRQVRKSRSASVNGVKTHFHIAPCLPTDQSQPKPCPVTLHWLIYNGLYKLGHVQPLALTCIQWLLQAASCATSCIDFYRLRHVQILALTYIQWLLQAASCAPSCIELCTMASTNCVKCNL